MNVAAMWLAVGALTLTLGSAGPAMADGSSASAGGAAGSAATTAPATSQPEAGATSQPAGTQTKTAWYNAKVGDAMVYKMPVNDMKQSFKVIKVDDKVVTVTIGISMNGQEPNNVQVQIPRVTAGPAEPSKMPDGWTVKDVGTEKITVSGQELICKVTQTLMKVGDQTISTRSWTSEQVPGGIVKNEDYVSGKHQIGMELIEFKKGS